MLHRYGGVFEDPEFEWVGIGLSDNGRGRGGNGGTEAVRLHRRVVQLEGVLAEKALGARRLREGNRAGCEQGKDEFFLQVSHAQLAILTTFQSPSQSMPALICSVDLTSF